MTHLPVSSSSNIIASTDSVDLHQIYSHQHYCATAVSGTSPIVHRSCNSSLLGGSPNNLTHVYHTHKPYTDTDFVFHWDSLSGGNTLWIWIDLFQRHNFIKHRHSPDRWVGISGNHRISKAFCEAKTGIFYSADWQHNLGRLLLCESWNTCAKLLRS